MMNILMIYRTQVFDSEVKEQLDKYSGHNITFVAENEKKKLFVKWLDKDNVIKNIVTSDEYLEGKLDGMRFDQTVSNPPYQNNNQDARRWVLWHRFVLKSIELSDRIDLITPYIGCPGPLFDRIKNHIVYLDLDAGKNFKGIASTFCSYSLDMKNKIKGTKVIQNGKEYIIDLSTKNFLPAVVNDETLKMIDTLNSRKRRVWKRGEFHTSHKEKFSVDGRYEVLHTNAQTLRSNIEHDSRKKYRVGVSLSGYPIFKVIHNQYCTETIICTEFESIEEAQLFADECNGSEIQEIMKTFKWSGWNSKAIISML